MLSLFFILFFRLALDLWFCCLHLWFFPYDSSCGWSNRDHVRKHIRMANISKIVRKHTICFIFVRVTLKAIQSPISPINIGFLQITNQIVPGHISLIVAELAQQKWIAQASNICLRIKHFLSETIVRYKSPRRHWPWKTVEMASIDKFILNWVLEWCLYDCCQI